MFVHIPLWVAIPALVIIVLIIISAGKLKPDELIAVSTFGIPLYEAGPGGPYGAIPLIMETYRFLTTGYQAEWETDADVEITDRGAPAPGQQAPIRIAFVDYEQADWYARDDKELEYPMSWAEYKKKGKLTLVQLKLLEQNPGKWDELKEQAGLSQDEASAIENDPRHQSMNGELKFVTKWRNKRGFLFQFIRAMKGGTTEEKVDEFNRQINDLIIAEAQAICIRMTFIHAQFHQRSLNNKLQKFIEAEVQEGLLESTQSEEDKKRGQPTGADIEKAYFKSFNPGKTINQDLARAAAAKSRRTATILDAQAKRQAIREIGFGEAEVIEEKGKKIAASPAAARAAELEASVEVAKETEIIIATGDQKGGTNILPQVAAMQQMIQHPGNKQQESSDSIDTVHKTPEESSIDQVGKSSQERPEDK